MQNLYVTEWFTTPCMGVLYSMLDNRVYLINWDDLIPLSVYLEPAHLNWLARPVLQRQESSSSSLENNKPSQVDRLWISTNRENPYLDNPCEWRSNATGVYYLNNILKSQKKMNPMCLEQIFPDGKEDDLMWHTIFWTLFRFTERTKRVGRQMLGSVNPKYYVGVHVRAGGNGTSFVDPNRHGSVDDWKAFSTCTTLMQAELTRKCGSLPSVYVASDNDEAKRYLQEHGSDVHASNVEIYHIDRSNATLIRNLTSASDAVWADFKILMDATCLVVGKSGFSLLAMHMSPIQPHCAVAFNKCTLESVREAVQQSAQC